MTLEAAGSNAGLFPLDYFRKTELYPSRTEGEHQMQRNDVDTRAVMVLQREAARMRDAAERVDLVVRAMALRRGLRPTTEPERHGAGAD